MFVVSFCSCLSTYNCDFLYEQSLLFEITRLVIGHAWVYHICISMRVIISCGLYICYPIFQWGYIVKWLILQAIYVQNKESIQFLGLKSAVSNQERVDFWLHPHCILILSYNCIWIQSKYIKINRHRQAFIIAK